MTECMDWVKDTEDGILLGHMVSSNDIYYENDNATSCYIMAGTFTRRESGDRSARTKQEGKGSECKL